MKVLRSTFVAAAAIFAVACGDKVNIIQPGPAADGVSAVAVAPGTSVMSVGQTVSFSAIVTATGAAATTVTWSSTDNSKVSVSTAGVATAVAATPGVAICATSTVNANAKGCASVSVISGPATTPPSVSISAVNFTNGVGIQQPAAVPPGFVAGQLNVVMNVNAGTAVLDSIVLKLDGKNAYKQAFTAAQSAALLTEALEQAQAADVDQANQFGGATITASVNTADYNTTTGVATWQNGNRAFQAIIYGKNAVTAGGAPTNVQGASPAATYRLGNADGFHMAVTYTVAAPDARTAGETQLATAVDAAGYAWRAGGMNISALFVQYTPGVTPLLVNATYNNFGCSAGGVRTFALANTGTGAPVAGPYTATVSNTATAGAGNVTAYEFNPAAAGCGGAIFTSGGEIPNIIGVATDNNNLVLVAGGVNGGAGVLNAFANSLNPDPTIVARLDNAVPGQSGGATAVQLTGQSSNTANFGCAIPTTVVPVVTSMAGRTNCWFNDAVILNGRQTGFPGVTAAGGPTSTNGIIASGADLGSGRVIGTGDGLSFTARVGLNSDANATIDATAAVTSVAGLAESATNTAYRVRVRAKDPLGNTANVGAAGGAATSVVALTIGVDRTAPGLAFVGGPAANARTAAYAANTPYFFGATDNAVAPAAPSGFFNLAATPLTVRQTRREVTIGTRFWCMNTATYMNTANANPCPTVAPTGTGTTATSVGWASGTAPDFLANLVVCDIYNATAAIGVAGTNPCNMGGSTGAIVSAAPLDQYATISATVADQAANVSPAASRVELLDVTASAIGGLSYNPFLTAGGPATFSSALIDNLDIQSTRMNLQYGPLGGAPGAFAATISDANTAAAFAPTSAVGGSSFWYPDVAVNGYNQATLVPTANMSNTVAQVYTNMQITPQPMGANTGAFAADGFLNTANGIVLNQANTATPSATPIIAGAIPATQTAISNTGAAGNGPVNWFICGTNGTTPAVGTACPATPAALAAATVAVSRDGTTAATNTVISIDAVATGTTGVFNNPFSSVQFWVYNPGTVTPANEGWRLIGNVVNSSTVTDGGLAVPAGRNWHFTLNYDPTATDAQDTGETYRIMAIGIGGANLTLATSRGTALVTPIGGVILNIVP